MLATNNHIRKAVSEDERFLKDVAKASRHNFVYDDRSKLDELEALFGWRIVRAGINLNRSCYKRRERIKNRIEKSILSGKAIFLTLTFTDETLAKTNDETRRKYVRRYLKEQCSCYVANIDFGSENGREHYHALVEPIGDAIDYEPWHEYGCIKGEVVRSTKDDVVRTTKYVAKLTNHALKETAGISPRLIYSRGNI